MAFPGRELEAKVFKDHSQANQMVADYCTRRMICMMTAISRLYHLTRLGKEARQSVVGQPYLRQRSPPQSSNRLFRSVGDKDEARRWCNHQQCSIRIRTVPVPPRSRLTAKSTQETAKRDKLLECVIDSFIGTRLASSARRIVAVRRAGDFQNPSRAWISRRVILPTLIRLLASLTLLPHSPPSYHPSYNSARHSYRASWTHQNIRLLLVFHPLPHSLSSSSLVLHHLGDLRSHVVSRRSSPA